VNDFSKLNEEERVKTMVYIANGKLLTTSLSFKLKEVCSKLEVYEPRGTETPKCIVVHKTKTHHNLERKCTT